MSRPQEDARPEASPPEYKVKGGGAGRVWNEVWKTHGRMPKRGLQMENYKVKQALACSWEPA